MDSSSTEYYQISDKRVLGDQPGRTLLLGKTQSCHKNSFGDTTLASLRVTPLCCVGYGSESGAPQVLCVGPANGYGRGPRPLSPSQFISISPLEYNKAQHDRICNLVWPRFAKKNKANLWRAQLGNVETKKVTAAYEHQREVLSPSLNAQARCSVD